MVPPTTGSGGTYVHAWIVTGVPTHPAGVVDVTVSVCVPSDWHADNAE